MQRLCLKRARRKGSTFIIDPILILFYIYFFWMFVVTAFMIYAVSSVSIADTLYKPFIQSDFVEAFDDLTTDEFEERRNALASLALGGAFQSTLKGTDYEVQSVSQREGVLVGNHLRFRAPMLRYNISLHYLQMKETFKGDD